MKRLVVSAVMLAVGGGLGAVAYALPEANSPRPAIREGGVFRVSMGFEEFDYVDPALAYRVPSWKLLEATCAKLTNYPDKPAPDGLRAVPEVARSYRVSKNGRVYTFSLRRGYRFSDGTKLDARGFARRRSPLCDPRRCPRCRAR